MELSERLKAVCNLTESGSTAADVGCDHGYVSIELAIRSQFNKVIAMDINKGPLAGAQSNIDKAGLSEVIECRLSNGLTALKKDEADCIIIAGMGGGLIINILTEGKDKLAGVNQLIIGAQSDVSKVRSFLRTIGFMIQKEDMILEDGKYYQLIKAVPYNENDDIYISLNYEHSDKLFDTYGPYLLKTKHPVMYSFLLNRRERFTEVSKALEKVSSDSNRLLEIKEELSLVDKGLEYYK